MSNASSTPPKTPSLQQVREALALLQEVAGDPEDLAALAEEIRRVNLLLVRIPELRRVLDGMQDELEERLARLAEERSLAVEELTGASALPSLEPLGPLLEAALDRPAATRPKGREVTFTRDLEEFLRFFPESESISLHQLALQYKGADSDQARDAARTMVGKLKKLGLVVTDARGVYSRAPSSLDSRPEAEG